MTFMTDIGVVDNPVPSFTNSQLCDFDVYGG